MAGPNGSAEDSEPWGRLLLGLVGLHLLVVLVGFTDYGVTYDADWRLTYGAHAVAWYTSGFSDDGALTYWTLPNEGAFFGMCVDLLGRLLPLGRYATAHLLGGLMGCATVLLCGLIARRLCGPRAGFLAALLLVLTPRFFGHAFNNPVDGPLAFWCAAATWALLRWLDGRFAPGGPRAPGAPGAPGAHGDKGDPAAWRRWGPPVLLGICLGAGLGTRIGALLLVGNTLVGVALFAFARRAESGGLVTHLRCLLPRLALAGVVTWLVMILFWPAAQVAPLWRPLQALKFATGFPFGMEVFYRGEEVAAQDLPATYVVHWFGLSLPEPHLLGLGILVVLAATWAIERRLPARLSGPGFGLVAFAAGFPLLYTLVRRPTEYDGMRHYLFVLPLLAVLIGVAWDEALVRLPRMARGGLLAVMGIGLVLAAVDMVRLHPYQAVYFNRTVAGGLEQAVDSFEGEYWGSSFKEACEWTQANVPPGTEADPVWVGSNLYPESTRAFLDAPGFAYAGSVDEPRDGDRRPDIYLCVRRWDGRSRFTGEVLHRVERLGVPLCWVVRVSD